MTAIIYTIGAKNQQSARSFTQKSLTDNRERFGQDNAMNLVHESGRRLKAEREKQNLTLRALAARLPGFSPSRISNYEHGRRRMRQKEATALAEVLGISSAYLMCLDENHGLSPEERKILEWYNTADSRGKRIIEQIAEAEAGYALKLLTYVPRDADNR